MHTPVIGRLLTFLLVGCAAVVFCSPVRLDALDTSIPPVNTQIKQRSSSGLIHKSKNLAGPRSFPDSHQQADSFAVAKSKKTSPNEGGINGLGAGGGLVGAFTDRMPSDWSEAIKESSMVSKRKVSPLMSLKNGAAANHADVSQKSKDNKIFTST
jgi:hypothetical protein